MKHIPDLDALRTTFAYDPQSGAFAWNDPSIDYVNHRNLAGGVSKGYRQVSFGSPPRRWPVHKLAWHMTYETWPSFVCHRNGNTLDNSLRNLYPGKSSGRIRFLQQITSDMGRATPAQRDHYNQLLSIEAKRVLAWVHDPEQFLFNLGLAHR